MVFSSLSFLVVFLPVLCVLYFIIPQKLKNIRQYLLLAFSLMFYGSGEPKYIFLIVACIGLSWILSRYVEKHAVWALLLSVLINIVPLIVTKYSGFIIKNIGMLTGNADISLPSIVMPIGISFYTFQVLTYIVDLYRGRIIRQKNPLLFTLYIMFFPQLIAGPIVKYEEIAESLENPDISVDNVKYGVGRLIMGLGKKVLLANQAGFIASSILQCSPDTVGTGMAWLCVIAYTVQIYFDFSGYSEMAIGLGAIFGFHFPENFKDPYTSTSIAEFWRRWHITLGRFFREYVYIPLGGNRVSTTRWMINIFIVWALTGLWHGASWNFVIWGVYYGVLITVERLLGLNKKIPRPIGWAVTLLIVMVGWAIFMLDQVPLREIGAFIGKMFFINGRVSAPVTVSSLRLWSDIPFLAVGIFASTPLWVWLRGKISASKLINSSAAYVVSDVLLIGVFLFSVIFLMGGTYNPFIYFRF